MEQTYTAIETLGGFLAFTDTAEGRRKLRQFLQQTADAYFNPAFNSGALSVYRAEGELGNRPGSTRGGCGRTSTPMARSLMATRWNSSTEVR